MTYELDCFAYFRIWIQFRSLHLKMYDKNITQQVYCFATYTIIFMEPLCTATSFALKKTALSEKTTFFAHKCILNKNSPSTMIESPSIETLGMKEFLSLNFQSMPRNSRVGCNARNRIIQHCHFVAQSITFQIVEKILM